MRTKVLYLLAGLFSGLLLAQFAPVKKLVMTAPVEQKSETAVGTTTQTSDKQTSEWYPVVKVVDGDTVTININGKNTTLRLIGLDTPETVDPRRTVQCFGKEASDEAKKLMQGQSVRIELDESQGTYDKYGRTLAYVYVPADSRQEGIMVNQYMIAEGFGHEYTYNLPYKYQAQFKTAQKSAQEQKRGLWADSVCGANVSMNVEKSTNAAAVSTFVPTAGTTYDCSHNSYNCSNFKSQAEAQYVFDLCGGSGNDVHKLDSDGDRRVCESLP